MIELIILFILQKNNSNIYEIKKFIVKNLALFYKHSMGTIHQALLRLEKNNLVKVEKKLTNGGKKISTYIITAEGTNFLNETMCEPLGDNPALADQLINLKLIMLTSGCFSNEITDNSKKSIKNYLENRKNLLENEKNSSEQNKKISQLYALEIKCIDEKLRYLN